MIFEISDDSQVIAKYLDEKLELGLFPANWRGVQSILWRYIENEIEGATFRLNDIYWQENVPARRPVAISAVQGAQVWPRLPRPVAQGAESPGSSSWRNGCCPFEKMLTHQPFLLDERPALRGFRPVRHAGKFSLFRPLPAARSGTGKSGNGTAG